MPHHCALADERNAELSEHVRKERPPPHPKRRIFFTILLIFQATLLLSLAPGSLFILKTKPLSQMLSC